MTNAEIVCFVAIELSDECIVLSGADFDRKPFAIMIDDWQQTKDTIDAMLSKADPKLSAKERVKADPELFKKMTYAGLELMYAKDSYCCLSYDIDGYELSVIEPKDTSKALFDNADDLKAEFLKLNTKNPNRDWVKDFELFMDSVRDVKDFYDIN